MLKRKVDSLLNYWKNNRNQAIIITGARQIGKTYSIEKFLNENFDNYIEINFAMRTNLIDLFAAIPESNNVLLLLSAIEGEKLVPHKTAIFFDEIQLLYRRREELKRQGLLDPNSQDLLTAVKSLVLDGRYRFIFSGSLLGVSIKDVVLNPTGYLDRYQMYPLDFEEFLWAKGVGDEAIIYLKNCFDRKEEVDNSINKIFLDYYREYLLIGGMPEAVSSYISDSNLYNVEVVQKQIIENYHIDITTYVDDDEKKIRLREIYDAIPAELNNRNKRFISSHVLERNYLKKNSIEDEFLWLRYAGVAIPVYNVTEAVIPLVLASERKTLKLFYNDIGLLCASLLSTGIRERILMKDLNINFGAPVENAVAQELYAHGFNDKLFYYNSKKHGEVDFIIEYENTILPIEVKSGETNQTNTYNHNVLNNLIKLYDIKNAYVFGDCNIKKETDVIYQFPIYMISFIKR